MIILYFRYRLHNFSPAPVIYNKLSRTGFIGNHAQHKEIILYPDMFSLNFSVLKHKSNKKKMLSYQYHYMSPTLESAWQSNDHSRKMLSHW